MSIQTISRCGAALFFVALVSGCSSTGSGASGQSEVTGQSKASAKASASSPTAAQCKANRGKCLYEGAYEPGERDYAEQEAKRLNLAELQRLRRSMGN
jgi:hypothetical protein